MRKQKCVIANQGYNISYISNIRVQLCLDLVFKVIILLLKIVTIMASRFFFYFLPFFEIINNN
jgi:hypothetical protein